MKEKISTGPNDRPRNESIAQTAQGLPDDSGGVIDVAADGTARMRDEEDGNSRPTPHPGGAAVDDEDPDYSPMDRSPARNKDRARDEPRQDGAGKKGIDEVDGAAADEDTFD